jgi:large subunit ribosomal protein L18
MKILERQRLRLSRKKRIKKNIQRHAGKPRLTIFRSSQHIYAQIIDDQHGKTLVAESSNSPEFKKELQYGGNVKAAALVGSLLGAKAVGQGIKEVICDRNGFIYAGRVKALADAVREKGVKI